MCLSGGAEGADLQWGMNAGRAGHQVIHFSFGSHRSKAPDAEIVRLTEAHLLEADEHVRKANETLNRRYPASSDFVNNLLRRNWYQVRDSEAIFAVASFKSGQVTGGTAWAVQMFLDKGGTTAFVYDQVESRWMTWQGGWEPAPEVPMPSGVYAGVGSRDLKENGKFAIRGLYF
jgi:hypothetical protein